MPLQPEERGRIADARARRGLSQAELASSVSLDRSALSKIENGTRRVSAIELARIADTLDERIEWFVSSPPPSIVSHRNLAEPGAPNTVIDRVVERVARNVEFIERHDDRWNPAGPPQWERPDTVEQAERAASRARALLRLDDTDPFLDTAGTLSDLGLLVFSFDLGADAADAASILLLNGGVAVINGHRRVGQRRIAVAHELDHYLFADEYTVDWRIAEQGDDAGWEARLDRFGQGRPAPAARARAHVDRAAGAGR